LHRQGFIHRDLKPENVLLTDGGRAFIADLGFGTSWHPKKVSKTQCGSLLYASPEIVGNKEYVGPEVDIWSLGVMLYAMTTGRHPFHGNDEHVRGCIQKGAFVIPPYFSSQLVELLQGCLNTNRKERFTIDQVVSHPWLASVVEQWRVTDEDLHSPGSENSFTEGDSSGDEEEKATKKKSRRFSFGRGSPKSNEDLISMIPSPSSSPAKEGICGEKASSASSSPKKKRKDSKG